MKSILKARNPDFKVFPDSIGVEVNQTWKIPSFGRDDDLQVKENKKCNKFLSHQFRRTQTALNNGNILLIVKIYWALLLRSKSFKIYWFNKVLKGWYFNRDVKDIKRIFDRFNRNVRKANGTLMSKRLYIPKPDGRRRPLGVPRPEWRVEIAALSELLSRIIGPRLSHRQHGFLPNRNAVTAWEQILHELNRKPEILEFDLDSCFNKINIKLVSQYLKGIGLPEDFVRFIERINSTFPLTNITKMDPEDKEVNNLESWAGDHYDVVKKVGMPQGLPWSPILSIFVIDNIMKELDLEPIMFADDGLIFTSNANKALDKLSSYKAKDAGIFVSNKPNKKTGLPSTRIFRSGEFQFLGLNYNIDLRAFIIDGQVAKVTNEVELKKFVIENYNKINYNKADKPWTWTVRPDSLLNQRNDVHAKSNMLDSFMKSVENVLLNKRYPILINNDRYFDILRESTFATNWLLRNVRFKNSFQIPMRILYKDDTLVNQTTLESEQTSYLSRIVRSKYLWTTRYMVPRKDQQYLFDYKLQIQELNKRDKLMQAFYKTKAYVLGHRI